MLYCINLPLNLLQDCLKGNFYLSKNQKFTNIDSNENINLLKNFETLFLPK